MKKVLLVDDDLEIHQLVTHSIGNEFTVVSAHNLLEAKNLIKITKVDLIVLDEMLPDGSGTDFCFFVKNELGFKEIPILMLTQKKDLKDKLMAFNSGADDYMVKPFEPLELLARINARLRELNTSEAGNFVLGDLHFELSNARLFFVKDDEQKRLDLTPIEFKILFLLAKNRESIYSRDDILKTVWGEDNHVVARTVDQHISKIRKKIEESQYTVKSSHGKGYRLIEE